MSPKEIGVAAVSGLILAATVAGPVLAALDEYPAPFISDGKLDNTIFVVGANAATADVVGAINIAAALAQEATSAAVGEGTVVLETTTVEVSEGVRVEAPGDDLNYGEDFYDVFPSHKITSADLDILADQTYTESEGNTDNDEDYTQEIIFSNGANIITFTKEDEDPEKATTYLQLDDGIDYTYTYILEFDDKVEYDDTSATTVKEDFLTTEIVILGNTYTIVNAKKQGSAPYLYYLELMSGAVKDTLNEGDTGTYTVAGTDYEVTLDVVTSDAAQFTVNGEVTTSISEGGTYELADGTEIGVTDIIYQGWAGGTRRATFYLGAKKITLEHNKEVDVAGTSIDGSDVQFTSATSGEWTKLEIRLTVDDDVYLEAGEEWVDPVFGSFKFVFTGLEKTVEEIEGSTSADDGKLVLTNNAGDKLTIPFVDNETHVWPGDDLVASGINVTIFGTEYTSGGNLLVADGDECYDLGGDVTDCEGIMLLAVSSGGEARILEITDIDTTNNEVDIKDLTTGARWDDKDYTNGTTTSIALGGFMTIQLKITEDGSGAGKVEAIDINAFTGDAGAGNSDFETSLAGEIDLQIVGGDVVVELFNDDGTEIGQFEYDVDADGDMEIDDLTPTMYAKEEDSDIYVGLDTQNWGAIFTWDSENKDDIEIEYPEEKAIAVVYVSPTAAITAVKEVEKGVGDVIDAYTIKEIKAEAGVVVNPIPEVGVAMLDTEAAAVKDQYNMIVVGGGAANSIAMDLEDKLTYASVANLRAEGSGYSAIELVEDAFASGFDVLVVAGYKAEETQGAF